MAIGRSSNLVSPQYARRRRQQLIRQSVAAGVSLIIIFSSIVFISRLEIFRIQSVKIEGNSVTAASDIEQRVAQLTAGKYLFLFPRNNILLYPRRGILSAIRTQWLRIDEASAKLNGQWSGHPMLVVKVSERQPMYVWCGYSAPAPVQPGSVGEQCLYSDETGYLYAPAPTFSGTPYIKLYGGIATGTPAAGAHYLASSTPGSFGSSLSFVSAISGVDFFSAAFKPLALIAKDDKNRNEFEVVTISGARVLFTLDQDIQRSIEAFRRVVTAEKLSSQPIDYIDLRYGNKVYYKIR